MVFGDGAYVLRDARKSIDLGKNIRARTKLIRSSEDDLKQRIVDQLKRLPPEPEHLARICSRVFGLCASAGSGPEPDAMPRHLDRYRHGRLLSASNAATAAGH
jgi:hypothetical protein